MEDETMNLGEERIAQAGIAGITVNTYTKVLGNQVQESKVVTIQYGTSHQYDASLEASKTEVLQAGSMGETTEIYNITYVKFAEEFVGTTLTKTPVNQLVNAGIQLLELFNEK